MALGRRVGEGPVIGFKKILNGFFEIREGKLC